MTSLLMANRTFIMQMCGQLGRAPMDRASSALLELVNSGGHFHIATFSSPQQKTLLG